MNFAEGDFFLTVLGCDVADSRRFEPVSARGSKARVERETPRGAFATKDPFHIDKFGRKPSYRQSGTATK
jgi:hypothetical protein